MSERRNKIEYGDFQTPEALAKEVCTLLRKFNFNPRTIIEPSCGKGSFLEASVREFGTEIEYYGFDINSDYIREAEQRLIDCYPNAIIRLKCQDFFTFDWQRFLKGLPEPILLIGNPPWVTNAGLGLISSGNLPKKSNIKQLSGLDALTGKANFDISEWMLLKLIEASASLDCTLAVLCKTGVARKVLEHKWQHGTELSKSALYRIDASRWFNAAVDACLFVSARASDIPADRSALLYDSLNAESPISRFGMIDGHIVSDVDAHRELSHLNGVNYYRWRSGVKHDLAKIMEFRLVNGQLQNGLGETVDIEETCLYPLLKATELSKGITVPDRFVLMTQNVVGEDTERLRETAPLTYCYLMRHDSLFTDRKSSIYLGKPKYCMFGVGSYTFAPFKIAISGMHKSIRFTLLKPQLGKPILFDDTCYFIGCNNLEEATLLYELLNSDIGLRFLRSTIFSDSKRPITADVLNRLDIKKLAECMGRADELEKFIRSGNIESNGQGLLVFEPSRKYARKKLKLTK